MKKSIFVLSLFFLTALAFADEVKPLYRLPEKNPVSSQEGENETDIFLVGSDNGLFRVTNRNSAIPLWTEARVDQLLRVSTGWLMRTQKGIFYSQNLMFHFQVSEATVVQWIRKLPLIHLKNSLVSTTRKLLKHWIS